MKTLYALLGITSLLSWAVVTVPNAAASDVASHLSKLSTLIGQEVQNPRGEGLGEIEEVVIDAATGHAAYAVLAFGGFLGLGENRVAVPWRALHPSARGEAFLLNVTEAQLKNAPNFEPAQWPNMEDQHWGDTIHTYYGQEPYWNQRLPAKTARERSELAANRLLRSSQVLNRDVMNKRYKHIGEIEEVVVDTASGDVAYAVLSFSGFLGLGEKWFAIPWAALQPSAGFRTFMLDVTEESLERAPGFDEDQWPDMANRRWDTAVHAYFGQRPYWERREQAQVMSKTGVEAKPESPADKRHSGVQSMAQPPAKPTVEERLDRKTADAPSSLGEKTGTATTVTSPKASQTQTESGDAKPQTVSTPASRFVIRQTGETSSEESASITPVTVENAIGTVLALRGPIVISCQSKQARSGDPAAMVQQNRSASDAPHALTVQRADGAVTISCDEPARTEKQ